MSKYKSKFCLPNDGVYLLSHSVGRPLKTLQPHLQQQFFSPWAEGAREPWGAWLQGINGFTQALARLFNSEAGLFCPQVNLSSGLTKFLQAWPSTGKPLRILMSEADFPSMGFVMQQARDDLLLTFIDKEQDVSDANTWDAHLTAEFDFVFVSHVYSNTGQQAPIAAISERASKLGVKVILDVAQSAGILPLDLQVTMVDVLIGSSVKWLCSGPGAAYLWVSPEVLSMCQPKDVGWFSHANPFEFDIHHFQYHDTALRFWGGTPSVFPYVCAAHSINALLDIGIDNIRARNWQLVMQLHEHFGERVMSPLSPTRASGTAIVSFAQQTDKALQTLTEHGIAVDKRVHGIRVSPHIYTDIQDIALFKDVLKAL
jgi:kynureninase